ncbi:MAG: GNAT family N-acetyltransferase [Actinomycetota bacterium]|nr:GNAT family N-acetyltransferase [Actinomycetota bacterium]
MEIRVVQTDEQLQATLDLIRGVYPERALTLAEVRAIEATVEQTRFQVREHGVLLGAALIVVEQRLQEKHGAFASILVLPAARGRGTGTRLYEAVSAWGRDRGIRELEGNVKEDEPESLAWVERRGFMETGRDSRLELDLGAIEPPSVAPPEGIEIVRWSERPELAPAMYEVAREAYPDVPGSEDDAMEPYEDWLAHDMGGPGDKPEATFVALAGEEVVGYAKFSLTEAQPTVAYHDITAVRRNWRGRGIAGALKRAEIAWAKQQGYERLETMNEERNAPIRKLNERYRYRLSPGRIVVVGPLAE